jgi:hypothetical protein
MAPHLAGVFDCAVAESACPPWVTLSFCLFGESLSLGLFESRAPHSAGVFDSVNFYSCIPLTSPYF